MVSRREEYSEASRRALLEAARARFAAHGFAETSLDVIAADARLTKGALYHHFSGKQSLFEAVLCEVAQETVDSIAVAVARTNDPWDAALAALDNFLDRCLDPTYQRICFQEGPIALGFHRWQEIGEDYELGLIQNRLTAMKDAGLVDVDIEVFSDLLFGAMCAAARSIGRAKRPTRTRNELRAAIVRMIEGLA